MLRRYVEISMNTLSGVFKKISIALLLILLSISLAGGVWLWDISVAYADDYEGSEGGEDPQEATGIVLDLAKLELLVGDSQILTVTVTPEGALCPDITWSTSDENVATVDSEGLVTAKAEGTAQISFTAGAFTGVCEVTVRSPFTVKLDRRAVTLAVSDKLKLRAAVDKGSAKLNWASSNEAVAKVSGDGVVTAKSPGESVITVYAGHGVSDSCTVKVVPGEISAASCYQVDRSSDELLGPRVETTVSEMISNLNIDASLLRIEDTNDDEETRGLVKTGMTVSLVVEGEVRDRLTVRVLGDLDGDGRLGIYEYARARVTLLGLSSMSEADKALLDLNGDGKLSITDYILMRLHILKLDIGWDGRDCFPDIQPTLSKMVTAGCDTLTISWNAVESAAGYEIYRSPSASGTYTLIASVGRDVLSYTDSNLDRDSTYYYRVRAFKAVGSVKLDTLYSEAGSARVPGYTIYYQGDSRWGFSSSVRKKACVITAYAITINNMGIPCTPPDIYRSNGNQTPMNMTNLQRNFGVKAACALPAGSPYLASFDGPRTTIKSPSSNFEAAVKQALALHPEGVILYFKKGSEAHAVVACKISGGTIYYSDPGRNRDYLVDFANTWCKIGHSMSYKHLVEMVALDRV